MDERRLGLRGRGRGLICTFRQAGYDTGRRGRRTGPRFARARLGDGLQAKVKETSPVQVSINDRKEFELSKLGFMPVVLSPAVSTPVFLSNPSCHRPRTYFILTPGPGRGCRRGSIIVSIYRGSFSASWPSLATGVPICMSHANWKPPSMTGSTTTSVRRVQASRTCCDVPWLTPE